MNINELYQELIIDHGTEPRNHYKPNSYTHEAKGVNPLCGDKVHIYLTLDNNNTITEVSFVGSGCAISTASASLLTEQLNRKTISEVNNIFNKFQKLVTNQSNFNANINSDINSDMNSKTESDLNSDEYKKSPDLGKLLALAGIKEFPARVKCATLAWHALMAAIKSVL